MSNSTGTKTERLYAALNTLDALTLEMRKITDYADKVNRQLVELQYELVHLLDGKEENK